MTEKQGDAEEMAAMENATRATRLTVQPECIKFGTMRDYQIEGLNWLISLYDRGINGILADEMVRCLVILKFPPPNFLSLKALFFPVVLRI